MKKIILVIGLIYLLFGSVSFAATTQVDALIGKLVEKGILSRQESIQLKSEIVEDEKLKAEENLPPWVKDTNISYKFGKGVTIGTSDKETFKSTIGSRFQFRFTGEDKETGTDTSSFRIRRAKIYASGFAFKPDLEYKIQANFDSGEDGEFELEDYHFGWTKSKSASVQIGQYKVPFNRQELTSSGKQQFVDRAITNDEFNLSRDLGIMSHGKMPIFEDRLYYNLGIFNGEGPNKSGNDTSGMLYVTRLNWDILGKYDYSESDIKNSQEPQLVAGVAYAFEDREVSGTTIRDVDNITLDGGLKWHGLSLQSEYFYRERDVVGGATTISDGVVGQVGYFLIPEHLELAGRYAQVDPSRSVTSDQKEEWTIGLGYFFKGHDLKLQTDYSRLKTESTSGDIDDDRIRMQIQIVF